MRFWCCYIPSVLAVGILYSTCVCLSLHDGASCLVFTLVMKWKSRSAGPESSTSHVPFEAELSVPPKLHAPNSGSKFVHVAPHNLFSQCSDLSVIHCFGSSLLSFMTLIVSVHFHWFLSFSVSSSPNWIVNLLCSCPREPVWSVKALAGGSVSVPNPAHLD